MGKFTVSKRGVGGSSETYSPGSAMDPVVNTFLPCTHGANKRCAIGNTLSNIEQSLKNKFE
jgi:hypothetical protein